MSSQFTLLVVDDDELIIESLKAQLPSQWEIVSTSDWQNIPQTRFHAAFVDMHLTGTDEAQGPKVIAQLRSAQPHIEIIGYSGDLNRELMEACLTAGASRYLIKPLSANEFHRVLEKIEAWWQLRQASRRGRPGHWVGNGEKSQALFRAIAQLRSEIGPVLITGESGTGKEVVARLLHQQEESNHRPFVTVNIAAIPEQLFESELFGHKKGSFTGANSDQMGLAEAAHDGDLFLDEIEALSLDLQAKLLRFLESGELRRVGSQKTQKVSTRVIAATNIPLEELVAEKKFREDLYWRLKTHTLQLSPLRERKEDIQEICRHFLSQHSFQQKSFNDEAFDLLASHDWPGNVRELKQLCQQLVLQSPLPILRKEDVLSFLRPQSSEANAIPVDFSKGLSEMLANYEANVVQKCLDQYQDVDEAARILNVSRSNLYKKIKDYDIQWSKQ